MGNYEQLKAAIAAVIKQNGNNEITGDLLQNTLTTIVSNVGNDSTFAGVATPDTVPGSPDQNVFYIAGTRGVYNNFDGTTIVNEMVVFTNETGVWKSQNIGIALNGVPNLFLGVGYVRKDNGNINTPSSNLTNTPFLPIDRTKDLQIKAYEGVTSMIAFCAFYDSDYKFISAWQPGGATDGTRTATIPAAQIPANAVYIRCSGHHTVTDNYVIPFDLYNVLVNLATKTDVDAVIAQINTYLSGSYVYRGWAIPSTVPVAGKSNVFYIATTPGIYTNFGNFEVTNRLTIFRRTNPDDEFIATEIGVPLNGVRSLFREIGYIRSDTGKVYTVSTSWRCTPFLRITRNDDLQIRGKIHETASVALCAFYDKDYNFISSFTPEWAGTSTVTATIAAADIPADTVYIRCTGSETEGYVLPWDIFDLTKDVNDKAKQSDLNNTLGDFFTIQSYGLRYTDGIAIRQTNDMSTITPFIPLNRDADLIVSGWRGQGNTALLCFYDKDETFISSIFEEIPGGYNKDYLIKKENYPENAALIRAGGYVGYDCYIRNLTVKYLLDVIEGKTWLDMFYFYPDKIYTSRSEAYNDVPGYMRKANLTIKYRLNESRNIIVETSIDVNNWDNETNWRTEQMREIIDSNYLYAIIDANNNVLFAIDNNGICHFKSNIKEYLFVEEWDYLYCIVDASNNIVFAIDRYGNIIGKSGQSVGSSLISNNLKNQSDLLTTLSDVKNYGAQNAEYLIDLNFTGRISVKGKIKNPVNDFDGNVPFATFENGGAVAATQSVKHAVPTQATETIYGVTGKVPFSVLQSGFACEGAQIIYNRVAKAGSTHNGGRNNLCGDKIMMFWFKGLDVINKAYAVTKCETANDYFIPDTDTWGENTLPIIVEPVDGVATIDLLTPNRLYFVTGKTKKIVIADKRRTTEDINTAWESSSQSYIVLNWDNPIDATPIEMGASGIVIGSGSDTPTPDGFSTLQMKGNNYIVKNTATRAFNNYLPYEELKARSELFATYQDLYIDISNDTFTVGRDSTGVIFTTSLKDGSGAWKTLQDFYKEFVPVTPNDSYPREGYPHAVIPELSDFYITFYDMPLKDCSTILQNGKIYLIGEYPQQMVLNPCGSANAPYDLPYTNQFDCFPYWVYDKYDTQEHIFDYIIGNERIKVYVNGEKLTEINKTSQLRIGNPLSDILFSDLEITKGYLGDAEVASDDYYLISSRTPICFGLLCHNIYDTYIGSNHPLGNLGASITQLMVIAKQLQDKGYITLSMQQLADWKAGNYKIPPKSAILVCDDWQISRNWLGQPSGQQTTKMGFDFRVKQSFLKYGLKLNFAQVGDHVKGLDHDIVMNIRMSNCGVGNHTRWHNEPIQQKPVPTLFLELQEMRFLMHEYGFNDDVFVYNKAGGTFVAQQDLLDYFGYSAGVGAGLLTDKYTRIITNRFSLNRTNIGNNVTIDVL